MGIKMVLTGSVAHKLLFHSLPNIFVKNEGGRELHLKLVCCASVLVTNSLLQETILKKFVCQSDTWSNNNYSVYNSFAVHTPTQ